MAGGKSRQSGKPRDISDGGRDNIDSPFGHLCRFTTLRSNRNIAQSRNRRLVGTRIVDTGDWVDNQHTIGNAIWLGEAHMGLTYRLVRAITTGTPNVAHRYDHD